MHLRLTIRGIAVVSTFKPLLFEGSPNTEQIGYAGLGWYPQGSFSRWWMPKPSRIEAYKKYKPREVALKALSHLYYKPNCANKKTDPHAITVPPRSLKPHCTGQDFHTNQFRRRGWTLHAHLFRVVDGKIFEQ